MIGLARLVLVVAVTTPTLQSACGEDGGTPVVIPPGGGGEVFSTSDGVQFQAQVVASNLEIPWALAFAPDGRLFVTERPGRVRVIENDQLLSEPALTLTDVFASGEAGLMGFAFDPDFVDNQFVYLLYSATRSGQSPVNRVVRFREANNTLTDAVTLLDGIAAASIHDGGRLRFGPDGQLYVTMGDAVVANSAQDLGVLNGKILRIASDGTTLPNNPFASQVYSWGHRNPQGIDWHPLSGDLWATEHGNVGNDELNRIEAGANYGWPEIEGVQTMAGMRSPVLLFSPTIAPSGGSFYTGQSFPAFRNDFFFGALRGTHLHRVRFSSSDPTMVTSDERLLEGEFGRIRDVVTGPDGALYLCTNNTDGRGQPASDDDRIIRLVPAN